MTIIDTQSLPVLDSTKVKWNFHHQDSASGVALLGDPAVLVSGAAFRYTTKAGVERTVSIGRVLKDSASETAKTGREYKSAWALVEVLPDDSPKHIAAVAKVTKPRDTQKATQRTAQSAGYAVIASAVQPAAVDPRDATIAALTEQLNNLTAMVAGLANGNGQQSAAIQPAAVPTAVTPAKVITSTRKTARKATPRQVASQPAQPTQPAAVEGECGVCGITAQLSAHRSLTNTETGRGLPVCGDCYKLTGQRALAVRRATRER